MQNFRAWLEQFIEGQDSTLRATVLHDITRLQQSGVDSYETLLQLLNNTQISSDVRAIACWLLGKIGTVESLPVLIKACQSEDTVLKVAALQALRVYAPNEQLASIVLGVLLHDRASEARKAAAHALASLGTNSILPTLFLVLQNGQENCEVRGMVAETLSNFVEDRVIQTLIAALDDPCVDVRFWSAYALGEIGDIQALQKLEYVASSDLGVLEGWGSVKQESIQAIETILARQK